jgi:signal transduction histidine kinase
MAFLWYGAIGQTFTRARALPPSNVINQDLFWDVFGFPVQLLRAGVAIFAAIFVMRFLRSSEVETERQITELQDARLKEAQQRETLRGEMLRQIVSAQEAERKRIALELHDETGQALTAIGLGLRGVATTLRQDIDKASLHLRQLEGLVTQSLDELQRLISDLRPSHLDDLGLAATLRWYTKDIQYRTSLIVNFKILGDKKPLLSEVKTTLFRIAQEALTNVIKHADAKSVHLLLIYGETTVGIKIEDDGLGFDSHKLAAIRHPHYGITGMKERASLLGGYFSVESNPSSCTTVEVIIPYVQKGKGKSNENSNCIG